MKIIRQNCIEPLHKVIAYITEYKTNTEGVNNKDYINKLQELIDCQLISKQSFKMAASLREINCKIAKQFKLTELAVMDYQGITTRNGSSKICRHIKGKLGKIQGFESFIEWRMCSKKLED